MPPSSGNCACLASLLAFGVGGALAVSGAALQALLRNPLAEPWLLGLSGGAALGAVVAVVIGVPAGLSVAGCATLGALAAVVLVYRISSWLAADSIRACSCSPAWSSAHSPEPSRRRSSPSPIRSPSRSPRCGSSVDSAGLVAVVGQFVPRGRCCRLLLLWWLSRALDRLALGEETAAMLGVDVDRTRRLVILATTILTAASVAAAGVIGFVGLVVPHSLRAVIGPLHRRLLPAVFLAGGAFTVLADAAARTVLRPSELPVGVVTALVGVPFFAMLLRRSLR